MIGPLGSSKVFGYDVLTCLRMDLLLAITADGPGLCISGTRFGAPRRHVLSLDLVCF